MAIPVESFFLSPSEAGTLQARIQQMVAEGILDGRFQRGEKLPSTRKLARHLGVDPEAALRRANAKFTRRFARIEALLAQDGRTPEQSDLAEMDALWNRAKAEDKARKNS